MEVGLNAPYELEDGELHQEDCSDHPNNVKEGATSLGKSGNKIADLALRMDGHQQALEKLSDNQNYMQRDASTIREDGKEYVDISFQESSVPSLQNTERPYDYQNHIQRDIHKKLHRNDRKETGDMMISQPIHQQRRKRRYTDLNHIQRDGFNDRKDGSTITNATAPKRDSNEQSTKKKKILDSNHMVVDMPEPIEVGVNARDTSRFIRGTYKNTDRKEMRDMIIREPMSDQKNWKDRSRADVDHLQTDGFHARKTGESVGGIFRPEKKSSESTSENQSFQDSKRKEKEADEPIKAGVEFRDMRRTIRDWIDSKAEDHSIIWPPVVIIENIITGFNQTTKQWDGLKNNEIKSCLKSIKDLEYKKVMAIYNHRDGHRGSAVVIFDANETGFMNADNLSQCLQRAARGREDWCAVRPRGLPVNETDMERWNAKGLVGDDGTRLIYGYLAEPSDLDRLKRYVPRVSVESFVKKVLEPMKRRCQVKNSDMEASHNTAAAFDGLYKISSSVNNNVNRSQLYKSHWGAIANAATTSYPIAWFPIAHSGSKFMDSKDILTHRNHARDFGLKKTSDRNPMSNINGSSTRIVQQKQRSNITSHGSGRRCSTCHTNTTPLWRNGPKGPKSLCNACGIRYKKEERRAASTMAAVAENKNGFVNQNNKIATS